LLVAEENMEKNIDETVQEEETEKDTVQETEETVEGDGAKDAQPDAEETAGSEQSGKPEKSEKTKTDALVEELNDRIKRQMAEFDNFRKRSEKEKAGMFDMGAKSVIEKILPVVDNFERGLSGVAQENMADPFVDGMNMIYKQMLEMLEKLGVKPIEAVGSEFNPDFHNAVMHVEDEEAGDNVVVEEFLKGYTYKDQVVRHSMVKVAN